MELRTVEGRPAVWLDGAVTMGVVGTSYNGAGTAVALASAARTPDRKPIAWLVPEPHNPHDANAVAVYMAGAKIGHMARERAAEWQPILIALITRTGAAGVACEGSIYKERKKVSAFLQLPEFSTMLATVLASAPAATHAPMQVQTPHTARRQPLALQILGGILIAASAPFVLMVVAGTVDAIHKGTGHTVGFIVFSAVAAAGLIVGGRRLIRGPR